MKERAAGAIQSEEHQQSKVSEADAYRNPTVEIEQENLGLLENFNRSLYIFVDLANGQ